jgi:hypothetical protein
VSHLRRLGNKKISGSLPREFKPILTTIKDHHRCSVSSTTSISESFAMVYGQMQDDRLDKAFDKALQQFEGI